MSLHKNFPLVSSLTLAPSMDADDSKNVPADTVIVSVHLLRNCFVREAECHARLKELERLLHESGAASQRERIMYNQALAHNTQLESSLQAEISARKELEAQLHEALAAHDAERKQLGN
ncbi:predicted protein [Uncinocarpus reesii 1704]|uniref:Uncharacterized protein n=1 Tax=Uncinocarpus reesii (strain UAMH 1704) TaxID=336963 RepID=C4K0A3_UNCRE|nr:uncharacterized protein UREG_07917 [Uncinocarpus reesii 1704]EEP83052.1 predicted protein [Uncinocarpus reesii 1704]